jgi:tRNA pseudouridine32 synthase/23S rRNA pseudouridine746 synthase
MNYEIIFENEDFLVVNKFEAISFNDETLSSGLFTELKSIYSDIFSIHRLDKVTSGLLIIGKTKSSAQEFGHLFSAHKIIKIYLAISDRKPKKKQGLIKGDMSKSRDASWKLLKTTQAPAITQFHSFSLKASRRLYILRPHTGKTHQLRVAMKSLGAPILGDFKYGGTKLDRAYLHAYYLKFIFKGKEYEFISKPNRGDEFLSIEFKSKINDLSKPLELNWPKL